MSSPNLTLYTQLRDGSFMKVSDNSGPYTWDGTNMITKSGGVFNGTAMEAPSKANTNTRLLSAAASVNATLVKNAPGTLRNITGYNNNAAVRYMKLYNKATAPTVGTDVPVLTIRLPATAIFSFSIPDGYYFSIGIGFGFSTGSADADTAALTAGDIQCLNVSYN